jgi:hypothetical protein
MLHMCAGSFPGILWDEDASDDDEDDEAQLNVGYKALNMVVEKYENKHNILKSFPTGVIQPQPFVEGSRQKLEKVAAAVKMRHGHDFPGAALQWDEFLANAPQSDDADEYVRNNPLFIPFAKELFGINTEDERYALGRDDIAAKKDQFEHDASAATKELDEEVWRTLPCMAKTAKSAVERVRRIKQDNGKFSICCCCRCCCVPMYISAVIVMSNNDKYITVVSYAGDITYEPYYKEQEDFIDESSSEEEDVSSSEEATDDATVPRWCTVRRYCGIHKYGDASAYVGLECCKRDGSEKGTIEAVVRNSSVCEGELHFAIALESDEVEVAEKCYVLCKTAMSTNKKNSYKVCVCTLVTTSVCLDLCLYACVCDNNAIHLPLRFRRSARRRRRPTSEGRNGAVGLMKQ